MTLLYKTGQQCGKKKTEHILIARHQLCNAEQVAPKMPLSKCKGIEFNLRQVTRKKLYKFIDEVPAEKPAGPKFIPFLSLKNWSFSIGSDLRSATIEHKRIL